MGSKWIFNNFSKILQFLLNINFTKKMRLEICYMRWCLTFLYELMEACKQPFEISHFFDQETVKKIVFLGRELIGL